MSGSRGLGGVRAGWRLALRVGRREARRAKWRSLLIVAMIALPVAGVTAVAVTYKTYDVNTAEGLDRRLGTDYVLNSVLGTHESHEQRRCESQSVQERIHRERGSQRLVHRLDHVLLGHGPVVQEEAPRRSRGAGLSPVRLF